MFSPLCGNLVAAGNLVGINTMIVGGDQGLAIASSVAEEVFQKTFKNEVSQVDY